jgi:hypothetical protein
MNLENFFTDLVDYCERWEIAATVKALRVRQGSPRFSKFEHGEPKQYATRLFFFHLSGRNDLFRSQQPAQYVGGLTVTMN